MIRSFKKKDLDRIMQLWLDTNISAHYFIEREYWASNYDAVKASMLNATIYVFEKNDMIQGFVGLMDHSIAGIFVSRQFQSNGIGKKLLDYVKNKEEMLSLSVYKENDRAVHFYLREKFIVSEEQIDKTTGKVEFSMHWIKGA